MTQSPHPATTVGVRYCGGCNPHFDRPALLERLKKRLPALRFVPALSDTAYPAVVVLCGCPSRCAGVADLSVPEERLVRLDSPDGLPGAVVHLERLTQTPDRH